MTETGGEAAGHRLSQIGVMVNFIAILPGMAFPILALTFGVQNSNFGGVSVPFMIAAWLAFSVIYFALSWVRFRYYTGDADIRIESGILSRSARSIPYDRIQDVGIEENFLARIFGLAEVKFETGSGKGDEGTLRYVTTQEAGRLRTLVREHKAQGTAGAAGTAGSAAAEILPGDADALPLFIMDGRRVLTLGFYSYSLVIFAVLGGAAQQLDFLLPFDLYDIGAWLGIAADNRSAFDDISWSARIIAAAAALLALIVIGCATGIIRTFLREYGFRLDISPRGFRRRRGLLTLTDVVMPLHRVQAATITTGPIRKMRGWYGLKFISLASDGTNEEKGDKDHAAAPLATMREISDILAAADIHAADDHLDFSRGQFQRGHFNRGQAAWWMAPILIAILLGLAAMAGFILFAQPGWNRSVLFLLPILLIIASAMAYASWRCSGYAIADGQILVRYGWWRQTLTIGQMVKIQTVSIAQGPLSRALGLCQVEFGIAGGRLTIPGLKRADARLLMAEVIRKVSAVDYSKISRHDGGPVGTTV